MPRATLFILLGLSHSNMVHVMPPVTQRMKLANDAALISSMGVYSTILSFLLTCYREHSIRFARTYALRAGPPYRHARVRRRAHHCLSTYTTAPLKLARRDMAQPQLDNNSGSTRAVDNVAGDGLCYYCCRIPTTRRRTVPPAPYSAACGSPHS